MSPEPQPAPVAEVEPAETHPANPDGVALAEDMARQEAAAVAYRHEVARRLAEREAALAAAESGTAPGCPFCGIAAATPGPDPVMVFEPLDPVTPGHRLVVPRRHVRDASSDADVTAMVMARAAVLARAGSCNIITSVGAPATQTVFHLHVHVVPRRAGDGLHLPWTGQVKGKGAGDGTARGGVPVGAASPNGAKP